MKPLLQTPHTRLFSLPIPSFITEDSRHPTRSEETATVARLISLILGPDVTYTHNPDGSPRLIGAPDVISISVSHGAGHAIVALSTLPSVGADIERWRPQLLRVAPRFVSTADTLQAPSPQERLLRLWTAKEAIYKAALTPGLPLLDICVSDSCASIPDGHSFSLTFIPLPGAMIALAEPPAEAKRY